MLLRPQKKEIKRLFRACSCFRYQVNVDSGFRVNWKQQKQKKKEHKLIENGLSKITNQKYSDHRVNTHRR